MEAELAENLEQTRKGEQFKIVDQANLPQKPHKPKMSQIVAIGFMLALGCGFGAAFLREYLDSAFWSKKEVESVLELPVIASIPIIQTDKDRRWKKIKLVTTACILLVMSSTLLYALFILWKKGRGLLPL